MKQFQGRLRIALVCFLQHLDLEVVAEKAEAILHPQGVSARGDSLMDTQVTPTTCLTQNHLEPRLGHKVPQGRGLSLRNTVQAEDLFRGIVMQTLDQKGVLLKIPNLETKLT